MMNSIHITDEVLQAYLCKEIDDDAITAHLAVCARCRKRLEEYQFVLAHVQEIKTEAFSFDLTALAMDTVVLYERKQRKKQALVYWLLFVFLFIALASFSIPFVPKVFALFDSTPTITTLLVLGTGLAVLLFLLADMARQYKTKADRLFKNNLQPNAAIAVQ